MRLKRRNGQFQLSRVETFFQAMQQDFYGAEIFGFVEIAFRQTTL